MTEAKNQQAETVEVADLDQFVAMLTAWHTRQVQTLNHFMQIPPGTPMEVNGAGERKLEGDLLEGFKAGVQLSLLNLGTLPFAAEVEEEEEALAEAGAGQSHGG